MISVDKAFDLGPSITMDFLKNEFPQYYKQLDEIELQPVKIILCSGLISRKDDTLEKILLVYSDRYVIIKSINKSIYKYIIEYKDIDYILKEGVPYPGSIVIEYKSDARERIFYDEKSSEVIDLLLLELRKNIAGLAKINYETDPGLSFSDMEEKKYPGAAIVRNALLNPSYAVCSLFQKKLNNRFGLLFRKTLTETHFTVVCKGEVIIFREKGRKMNGSGIWGDLLHIPLGAVRNVSIEATGEGMILRYLFNSNRKLEIFYENERTDQLLKIMSYINGLISK